MLGQKKIFPSFSAFVVSGIRNTGSGMEKIRFQDPR
jgi:hypothetical protein